MEFYILQLVGLVKLSCNIDIKIVPSLAYTLFHSVNQLGNYAMTYIVRIQFFFQLKP